MSTAASGKEIWQMKPGEYQQAEIARMKENDVAYEKELLGKLKVVVNTSSTMLALASARAKNMEYINPHSCEYREHTPLNHIISRTNNLEAMLLSLVATVTSLFMLIVTGLAFVLTGGCFESLNLEFRRYVILTGLSLVCTLDAFVGLLWPPTSMVLTQNLPETIYHKDLAPSLANFLAWYTPINYDTVSELS